MPAVPALIMAGGAIGGSIASSKIASSAQKNAAKRSPEELALMQQQQGTAQRFQNQGQQLYGMGTPALMSTIDYYRTLLDGSRAARMNAVSGEAQDVADAYQGADIAAGKHLQGGERAQAQAENSRAKAGQIARLVTGVRPGAAAALGSIGGGLVGQAGQFEGAGADIQAGLLGNSTANRQGAYQAGQAAGANAANAIGGITGAIAGAWPTGPKAPTRPVLGGADIAPIKPRPIPVALPPEVSY